MTSSRLCIWEPGDEYLEELEIKNAHLPEVLTAVREGFRKAESLAKEKGHEVCFWAPDGEGAIGSVRSLGNLDELLEALHTKYGYCVLDIVCCDATWGKLGLIRATAETAPTTRQ